MQIGTYINRSIDGNNNTLTKKCVLRKMYHRLSKMPEIFSEIKFQFNAIRSACCNIQCNRKNISYVHYLLNIDGGDCRLNLIKKRKDGNEIFFSFNDFISIEKLYRKDD